jgi:hypothetical protein
MVGQQDLDLIIKTYLNEVDFYMRGSKLERLLPRWGVRAARRCLEQEISDFVNSDKLIYQIIELSDIIILSLYLRQRVGKEEWERINQILISIFRFDGMVLLTPQKLVQLQLLKIEFINHRNLCAARNPNMTEVKTDVGDALTRYTNMKFKPEPFSIEDPIRYDEPRDS